MTPEWLIQVLWFVASGLALGFFYYYLAKKEKLKAIYCFIIAIVVVLIIVILMTSNDNIKNKSQAHANPLHVRYLTSLVLEYPGPLLYVYDSEFGKLIAPVGYAVVIEVVNNRPTPTKIASYYIDVGVGGQWIRLLNLSTLISIDLFWAMDSLKACRRLDFRTNSFDLQARDKNIAPGESIKGWMFFEWPIELRGNIPSFSNIRVFIENIHGEKENVVLDVINIQEAGISMLQGSELIVYSRVENADLSGLEVIPFVDRTRGLK
ncbi:MAG: hypothetical protein C0417_03295 [Chlorobiaceae bacterium]|nr:hypothetical protein [Chlorobiaceae bacterium]